MIAFPEIKPVAELKITEPEVHRLDNGIEVFSFSGSTNEVVKLDMVFDAGRWMEKYPLSASATAALMKSGTDKDSAFELEGQIDFLGSTIKASAGYNGFTLSLYCMTRHLESSLKIFARILHQGMFPESEIELYKINRQARLKVNLLKNDYVGDMIFKEMLFGPDHPYGYTTTANFIEALNREKIVSYYRDQLRMDNCFIGLAGNFKQGDLDLLNRYLGQAEAWPVHASPERALQHTAKASANMQRTEYLKDSVQASIFIGGLSLGKKHEDYFALSLLNLIYGGYFGSRLMKNIREEKGLTYGIYSYIQQYKHAAAFIINTETALEYVDQCLHEIYAEMERLRQQPIDDKELSKARNYIMGRLLDQVDGPFKSADTFQGLKSHGIPLSFLSETVSALGQLDADTLMHTAQKYFRREAMYEVIVK
jgi:predicted Zn-dependent peptidase